jgi:hypothetical protein
VRGLEGKRPLGRPGLTWEDNIKTYSKSGRGVWTALICLRIGTGGWALVNVVINVNKKNQLDASVCRHLFTATSNSTCFGHHGAHPQEFQKMYLLPLV